MLLQLIEGTVLVIATSEAWMFTRKKLSSSKKVVDDGIMKWKCVKYNLMNGTREHGFACPKCLCFFPYTFMQTSKKLVLCSCDEYHKDHFHFECNKCEYKNIMKTADDK